MNKEKKIPMDAFLATAALNGYEVFTSDEVADFYKEGMLKLMGKGFETEAAKAEFVSDVMSLTKIFVDKYGESVALYYRPAQVVWEKNKDGVELVGLEGSYADTKANQLLERVGRPYECACEVAKSIYEDCAEIDFTKAIKGFYEDTEANRLLNRVGMPYGEGIRVAILEDGDKWVGALKEAMGNDKYDEIFTEEVCGNTEECLKKQVEMVKEYLTPEQVKELFKEAE